MSQLPLRPIEFRGHTLQTFAAGDPAADTDDLPPIIFLHGFFVSLRFVPHAVPLAVRDSRRWHAVSLPCHPPAAAPLRFAKGDISPDWLADMVAHVAETLSPSRPPVLVGHSAGGFAVLNAAARDPARYAAVAAVNGFINGGLTLMERALQLLARAGPAGRLGFALSLKAGVINADLHERMSAGLAGDGESLRDNARLRRAIDAYLPDLQDLSPEQLDALRIFTSMMPDLECQADLRGLSQLPVLLINGAEDPIVPADHAREMAARLPSAQAELLEGIGHLPMFEDAAAYDRLLHTFLANEQAPAPGAGA